MFAIRHLLPSLFLLITLTAPQLIAQSADVDMVLDPTATPTPTHVGFFGGVAFNTTPSQPVLSADVGLRYSYFGLGASMLDLLDEKYRQGDALISRAPGIDFYLYVPTNNMPALHINGGAYFADSTIYGFGVGFMIPINGRTTGTTVGFGYHNLKGIQLNFGRLLEI